MSWAKPIKWVNHCGKVVTQLLDRHFERKHKLTHAAAKACFRLIKEEESGKKMLKCSLCNKVYKNLSHLLNSQQDKEAASKILQPGSIPTVADVHDNWTEFRNPQSSDSKQPGQTVGSKVKSNI